MDIIFRTRVAPTDDDADASIADVADRPPAPAGPVPAAAAAAAPAKRKAAAPRARSRNRVGGFCAIPESAHIDAAPVGQSSSGVCPQTSGEDADIAALRQKYGSHMDLVRLIFQAWSAYGLLYAEWMQEWPSEIDETVKQRRALSFLRRAIDFSEGMKDVSYQKHKSWYVFLTVWVASRQIAERGDLWAYATGPIEQRGA